MGADCQEDTIFETENKKEGDLTISIGYDEHSANLNVKGYGLIEPTKKRVRELIKALEESLGYFDKRKNNREVSVNSSHK